MAASRIRGITIEINGSTTGLDKALKSTNSTLSQTQNHLKDVNRLLKVDPGNAELLTQKQRLLGQAVSETKEKLDALKKASEQAAKTVGNYDEWKKAYTPIQEEIGKTQDKIKSLKQKMQDLEKAGKVDTAEYEKLGKELKNEQEHLEELKKKAKEVSDEFGNPISREQYEALQREIIETERNLEDLERQARETSSVLGSQMQAAGAKIKEVGGKVTSAGQAMMPVTTAIAGIGVAAVKTTADFDTSMSKVSAVSGATGEDFDRLREKARQMGRDTKFSAAEAADAMNYMAMAGWDTEDMLNSIDGVMNLAAASGEDLASVSDIVTDAMTAFGLAADGTSKVLKDGIETEVSNATRFVDVLAQTSRSSNTDVATMGETFKYVAPLAGAMGYSVEDAALMIGLMANSGIKGSQAGTSLRSVLTNLAKPSDDLKILMQELGISLDDGNGNMLSLIDVAEQLRGAFGELKISQEDFNNSLSELDEQLAAEQITEKEYENGLERLMERAYGAEGALNASTAATIAGKYGMSGLLAMTNATDEEFEELKESIYNSSGAAEEMSKTMQDNLSGQLTILKSQLAEAAIAIGDTLMPAIRDITSKIQEWVDKFNGLSDGQKRAVVAIGLVVAAIGPLLIILGTLISSVGSIVGGIGSLVTFASGTLIPMLAGVSAAFLVIPAAIAAVIAIGVLLYKNWDTIIEKLNILKKGFELGFGIMTNTVKNNIEKMKGFFNFSWSLPKLKMPHFDISGRFSLNPPSVPHFSVQWYRKAMDEAYVLKGASIFGQMNGKLLGGGESGSEIVAGTQYMMDLIRDATAQSNQGVAEAVGSLENRVVDIMAEYFPIFAEKGETEQYIKLDPHFSVMVGNRQFENYIVQTAEKGISGQQRSYWKAKGAE